VVGLREQSSQLSLESFVTVRRTGIGEITTNALEEARGGDYHRS
jgi:hypothetical protein